MDSIQQRIDGLVDEARGEVTKVDALQAKALLEVTAEVLGGLSTAYEHYRSGDEAAWQG
jgi:hypothetical protein